MADYAIGDVQGCFESLQYLLEVIHFDAHRDRLWFVGDLVNRGPKSLDVLRFVSQLSTKPYLSLGNHDLHLLSLVATDRRAKSSDPTLEQILIAPDCHELCDWLRRQPLLCFDSDLNVVMTHAGIAPMWTLDRAQAYAQELEAVLQGPQYIEFLQSMYGNTPTRWSPTLTGMTRLRVLCNYFTRMRFCNADGSLEFDHSGSVAQAPTTLYPWYAVPQRLELDVDVVFGHWAALEGHCPHPRIHAIDTGCVWGGTLTALRLQDKQRFSVTRQEKA
ncbi:MAG: diadenosine tetraphosphatase [Legionella sp.]|nr:MAG: diadenosine tetraphosphatase [Legionella sp.]